MATLHTYLNFNGNTEEAFNFYKSVFGGEFTTLQRFKDTPDASRMTAGEQEKIMHVSLHVGGSALMGTDVPDSMEQVKLGTNSSISIDTKSEEEANHLFSGLSAGGTITMPLQKMFWGAYFGMFTDKFGIQWMVNYDYNQHQ